MDIPQLHEIVDGKSRLRCGTGLSPVSEESTGSKPVPQSCSALNVNSYQSGIVMVKGWGARIVSARRRQARP
jgi:hypothetical protein